jgi:hypothetical protein
MRGTYIQSLAAISFCLLLVFSHAEIAGSRNHLDNDFSDQYLGNPAWPKPVCSRSTFYKNCSVVHTANLR